MKWLDLVSALNGHFAVHADVSNLHRQKKEPLYFEHHTVCTKIEKQDSDGLSQTRLDEVNYNIVKFKHSLTMHASAVTRTDLIHACAVQRLACDLKKAVATARLEFQNEVLEQLTSKFEAPEFDLRWCMVRN